MKSIIIGIAGGTGSGKTTLTDLLFIIGKPAPGFHPYPTTEHGCDTDFRLVQHHIQ